MNNFFQDIWRGLNASPKYLQSKYFYDEKGDTIFREIMQCPEYYLTNCELDIFSQHANDLANRILSNFRNFDLVELGPGDCSKSAYLLDALLKQGAGFTYYPIDISENIIDHLEKTLPNRFPGIKLHGLNGDYFDMLDEMKNSSAVNKVVLFLGSSIGNIPMEETIDFFKALKSHLIPGDIVLTGFDLKKDASVILAAYNDKEGITKRFNLNLLQRINDTLDADIDLTQFEHKPVYSEATGACKSYLVSKVAQRVRIGEVGWVHFFTGEQLFMEVSQKYTVAQTDAFAVAAGFTPLHHYYDTKKWFLDALWRCD